MVINRTTVAKRHLGPSKIISVVKLSGGMWRMVQDRSFGDGEYHESTPSEKKVRVVVQRNGINFLGVRFMYLGPLAFPVPQTGVFFSKLP